MPRVIPKRADMRGLTENEKGRLAAGQDNEPARDWAWMTKGQAGQEPTQEISRGHPFAYCIAGNGQFNPKGEKKIGPFRAKNSTCRYRFRWAGRLPYEDLAECRNQPFLQGWVSALSPLDFGVAGVEKSEPP